MTVPHPDRSRWRRALLVSLAITFTSGCASAPPISTQPPVTGPGDLIRLLAGHTDSLRNARTRSQVSMKVEGVRQKATSVVFYDRPSRLKMEVSGTLGVSILSAKFWDDSLRVYLPGDDGYLDGRAPTVLYQVTGMNLAYYDIQQVILGIPTLTSEDRNHVTGFQTTADHYILDLNQGDLQRRLWVDRARVVVTREDILDDRGRLLSRLRLSNYRSTVGCLLPTLIEIDQGDNHLAWSVESTRVNEGVDKSVFELNMPSGVVRLND